MKNNTIATMLFLTLVSAFILSLPVVNADPAWITTLDPEGPDFYPWINYKEIGTGLRIINDPLFNSEEVDDITPMVPNDPTAAAHVKGWVTFICTTTKPWKNNAPKGFEYSITVKDVPQGTYTVMAYPYGAYLPPPVDDFVFSDDFGIVDSYTLGTFRVVGNRGRGHLKGFEDVDAGFYAWRITVELDGTPIAETHLSDVADFTVIS